MCMACGRVAMNFVRKYGFDTVRVLRVPVNHGKVRHQGTEAGPPVRPT